MTDHAAGANGHVPEIRGMNVILAGAFNPSIVQPSWLALKGLIKPEEAEHAQVEIISRELVSFGLPESLAIQVSLDRLQIIEKDSPSRELVRDLAEGILRLLPESPVAAMGINHNHHFRVESEEAWHAFGHRIAPKEIWEGVLDQPGTRSSSSKACGQTDSRVGSWFKLSHRFAYTRVSLSRSTTTFSWTRCR